MKSRIEIVYETPKGKKIKIIFETEEPQGWTTERMFEVLNLLHDYDMIGEKISIDAKETK